MDFKIDKVEDFYVVRDDLVEGGTKRRVLGKYIEHFSEFDEYIYASPRQGYGQLSLSIVCAEIDKKSTIFIPKGKHTWITEKSIEYGAKVVEVPMGFLINIQRKARDYVKKSKQRHLMPFGFDHPIIINEFGRIMKEVKLDKTPPEVWSCMSSGVLSRGLQIAFPNSKVFGVQVGHNTDERERGRASVYKSRYDFRSTCTIKERPPFPSNLWYDAKAWMIVKQNASPDSLFWNCG